MIVCNINEGLATPYEVVLHGNTLSGCSAYYTVMSQASSSARNAPFCSRHSLSFWHELLCLYPTHKAQSSDFTRLKVVFPPEGYRIPSIQRHFKRPPGYQVYYLKSGDKVVAVMGASGLEHFSDPASPPATFWADPLKDLSMGSLYSSGLCAKPAQRPAAARPRNIEVSGTTKLQVTGPAPALHYVPRAKEWSDELSLPSLPWWESMRVMGQPIHTAYDLMPMVITKVRSALSGPRPSYAPPVCWFAGNMAVNGPYDSARQVFLMHSLAPELDLAATPFIEYRGERVYFKVLPFYYHSPQHRGHRCAAVLFSLEPIHLEEA